MTSERATRVVAVLNRRGRVPRLWVRLLFLSTNTVVELLKSKRVSDLEKRVAALEGTRPGKPSSPKSPIKPFAVRDVR